MTQAEVSARLASRTVGLTIYYYTGDGPAVEEWLVSDWESRSMPAFGATLKFEDGRLAAKELHRPTFRDMVEQLWNELTHH